MLAVFTKNLDKNGSTDRTSAGGRPREHTKTPLKLVFSLIARRPTSGREYSAGYLELQFSSVNVMCCERAFLRLSNTSRPST